MGIHAIFLCFNGSLSNAPQWHSPEGKDEWRSLSIAVACGDDVEWINVACYDDVAHTFPALAKGDRVYCEGWLRRQKGHDFPTAPLSLVATKITVLDRTERHGPLIGIGDVTQARLNSFPPANDHPSIIDGLDWLGAVRPLERLGVIGRNEPAKDKSTPDECPF